MQKGVRSQLRKSSDIAPLDRFPFECYLEGSERGARVRVLLKGVKVA